MSLFDFEDDIHISKRRLFAVICIDQAPECGTESPINEMIEHVISSLKEVLSEYEDISLAYVYESAGMTEAVPFLPFTRETECLYANLPTEGTSHNLNHLFFLSMAMLEQEQRRNQAADCRLYLLTNEHFPRVNQIVWQSAGRTIVNLRFAGLAAEIILYKSPGAGADLLESYIRSRPGSRVLEVHKTGFVEKK